MKIVFVYFDSMRGAGGKYYEGLASISAVLKQGHSTRLFHITDNLTGPQFLEIFQNQYADTDLVAFSSTTNAFYYIATYAQQIKKHYPQMITICGGVHPTLHPDEVISEPGIDIICLGEGEYPLLDLCDRLESGSDISSIPNLWIKKNSVNIIKNPVRSLIESLDLLPFPDRDIFDYQSSMDSKLHRLVFMGSRGCPFQCAHCCNHALKKIAPRSTPYVRFKSPDRLIAEIKDCRAKYPDVQTICFHDD
ncbi:unnamed protein product, partial [marine sediment metagenome]